MYDYILKIKEETDIQIVLEVIKTSKYYKNELFTTITLNKSPDVIYALKRWFFDESKQTNKGVALSSKIDCPTYHKNWREMYSLKLQNDYYLTAPDMYAFFTGEKPAWDMQLNCHFC